MRGRWKSFTGKWNRGELSEGWYEADVFKRVCEEQGMETEEVGEEAEEGGEDDGGESVSRSGKISRSRSRSRSAEIRKGGDEEREDEDEYGPSLPGATSSIARPRGPEVPSIQDLHLRRELDAEEREARVADIRGARKEDHRVQKERLEELVPRADAGTRERRLEKRKEVNEKMRAFREPSPGGDEVADEDLVGGGEGGIADYKRMLSNEKQKVSERQQRREEMARARAAEREERIRAYREREEGTIEKLRELARRRGG